LEVDVIAAMETGRRLATRVRVGREDEELTVDGGEGGRDELAVDDGGLE
jgi:hypothetical protein